jgi:hypothetical protein
VSDRVLIPFGNRMLVLPRDAFEAALRDGEAFAREALDTGTAAVSDVPLGATRLLTPADAARELAVDPSWLLRQAREGRIDYVRLGSKYVRFNPTAIAEQCARLARTSATATSATVATSVRRTRPPKPGGGHADR